MHYMVSLLINSPWLSGDLSQAMAPPFCIQFLHNFIITRGPSFFFFFLPKNRRLFFYTYVAVVGGFFHTHFLHLFLFIQRFHFKNLFISS